MIWGGSFVVMKNSVDLVPPSYLLALRFTLAAAFMALALSGTDEKAGPWIFDLRAHYGDLPDSGLSVPDLWDQIYHSQQECLYHGPLCGPGAFFILEDQQKAAGPQPDAAGLVAVIGLALLTLKHESGINLGDALTFLCGVCFAVHMICTEEYTKRCDPILLATVQVAAVGVFNWLLAPFLDGPGAFNPAILLHKSLILGLLYLSLICTTVGFLIQTVGQKYLSANTVSLLLSLEAVFGTLFSVIFLGEVLTGRMILGCVLMFSALLLSELRFTVPGKEVHG